MTTLLLNEQLNGIELYFDSKPNTQTLSELKDNGFRWSGFKKCWYAKQKENTLEIANKYTREETDDQAITDQAITTDNTTTETKRTSNTTKQKANNNILKSLWELTRYDETTNNVNKDLPTKEIAATIRKVAKDRFPFVKFSVTSDYNSINFYIMESPFEKDSIHLKAIQEYCSNLICSFRYCTSYDPYGDYGSSYNFYGRDCGINWKYKQTEQTEEHKNMIADYDQRLEEFNKEEEIQKELRFQEYLKQSELDKIESLKRQEEEKKQIEIINNNVTSKELETDKQYFIINSQFANANKNNNIKTYQEEIANNDYYRQTVKITREIHFNTLESLEYFQENLLNDFDFLSNSGGSYTDDPRINSMTDYNNMSEEERSTVIFNLYGVAVYFNNELKFVIDTQGYSYSRYVGLIDDSTITSKEEKIKPLINKAELAQMKQKADVLENISTEVITENNLLNVWNGEKWNEYKEAIKEKFKHYNFKLNKGIIQQLPEASESLKVAMYRLLVEVEGIQDQFKEANLQQGKKVTIFQINPDFGMMSENRITVEKIEFTKYAQYDKAVKVTYTPQNKRKQYYNYYYKDIIVYNGWVTLPKNVLYNITETENFTRTESKYLSCDDRQYDEILTYFESQGINPIINTYKPQF